eukprot:10613727-Lingulodinium_polyedra.AAC.1
MRQQDMMRCSNCPIAACLFERHLARVWLQVVAKLLACTPEEFAGIPVDVALQRATAPAVR